MGIEPTQSAWKAEVLPLNYTRENGAQGRNRTGTDFKVRRILSPVRLPVSPPGQYFLKNGDPQAIRTPDPLIKSQMLYRLSQRVIIYWLGYLDSNQGDDRVKVCCLTAWLYPNRWWRRADSNHRTKGTELQSAAFSHFATPPSWCRLKDLNPQPTDYKSVALPVELSRHIYFNGGG